jgi:hypothetical protein
MRRLEPSKTRSANKSHQQSQQKNDVKTIGTGDHLQWLWHGLFRNLLETKVRGGNWGEQRCVNYYANNS